MGNGLQNIPYYMMLLSLSLIYRVSQKKVLRFDS
jgi:hypothetical protein